MAAPFSLKIRRRLTAFFTCLTGAYSRPQQHPMSAAAPREVYAQVSHQTAVAVNLSFGSYLLGQETVVTLRSNSSTHSAPSDTTPTVLLSITSGSSSDTIAKVIGAFYERDDVFTSDFLTDTVIFQLDVGQNIPDIQWEKLRDDVGCKDGWTPTKILIIDNKRSLPEGPYFLTPNFSLVQAWRLFPDTQDAFATTFVPAANSSFDFEPVNTIGEGIWRQVAVPSRLYASASKSKPLAGKRISIKDNYKVSGIKTTQMNRAFVDTYGPETETAAYVRTLIQLGAVIVGKTKMCAFASSEEATDQWIDYHAPFNPRADGYQSPSGSTTGGAAALASYKWLDFSVGTDTTGSIRWPAAWNGLFGMRTTWEEDALQGVYPSCRAMDTVGLLSRSLPGLRQLLRESLPNLRPRSGIRSAPTRIFYCTDFPYTTTAQKNIVDEFVSQLEEFIGVKREEISIAVRWKECPPEEAHGEEDIRTYLNKTAYYPFYYDGYNEFSKFRADYDKKFGKPVYVGPYMRWKWDQGAEITVEQRTQSLEEMNVYKRWFRDNIMKPRDDGGSDTVLVLPCGSGEPKYRDLPNSPPGVVPPFSPNYIASMLGLPQIVIPIGEIPFQSRISGRKEYLPIVVSIAGTAGSDSMLVDLAEEVLKSAGKPISVNTGRFMFKPPTDDASGTNV